MKRILTLFLVIATMVSCKNDPKAETVIDEDVPVATNDIKEVSGTFIYYADAAVFQTKSELFGFVENEMLQDLIIQSEPLKTEESDEVAVTLKVKMSKKPENEEGWDNRIEILEIKKVTKANSENNPILKLGKEDQSI